jgi:hypothetical protein
MRALYLFLDRTTGVGRPLHSMDEPLKPIRTGAFAAWLASAPTAAAGRSDQARPIDDTTGRSAAAQGVEQARGPRSAPTASRP